MTESQGSTVNSVAICFAVISFCAVVLRLWARTFIVRSLGADDCEYACPLIGVLLTVADLICVGAVSLMFSRLYMQVLTDLRSYRGPSSAAQ